MRSVVFLAFALSVLRVGCRAQLIENPAEAVTPVPEAVRRDFKLAPFYEKFIDADGLPIVASHKVSDFALREAAWLVNRMIGHRRDILQAIARQKVRLAIMAPDEFTTDIPEHSDLVPKPYWDKRARGLGATTARPAVSCGEENLLGYPGDPYAAENVLVHEFGHVIHERGLSEVDPTFDGRLKEAFEHATEAGLWKGKYAGTNRMEYWAEGVQSWFDTNRENDSEHNYVNTRVELKGYDPGLAALLEEVFGDSPWRYVRPADRHPPSPHLVGFDPAHARRFEWPAELRAWQERFRRGEETMAPANAESLAPIQPEARADWRSAGGGARTTLYFLNASPEDLRVEWIDFEGLPQQRVILRPHDHFEPETFVGHVWRVTDSAAKPRAYFIAGPRPGKVVLKD
jgi:hypothetical protein